MKKERFLAKTFAGVENLLLEELIRLGATDCQILNRAVQFEGDFSLLYTTNYYCRTALRILWQVDEFTFASNKQFYENIFQFPAEQYLSKDSTLAISATLHETIFNTPLFASMLAKDAICDRFRLQFGERPNVDKENPDVQFHLHIHNDKATLFLDSSGESLHKRGYKVSSHPAPINEVLAAAMIQLSQWKADCDFIDFVCGSGTLLIEAAMFALNIPAGFYREKFGFFNWKNFDRDLWKHTINRAEIKEDVNIDFYGSDISPRYLGMARTNIEKARLSDFIKLRKQDLRTTVPHKKPSLIMLNPPYGERLDMDDICVLYKDIGDTLKNKYTDCKAFIISSDKEAIKNIGLRTSLKYTLFNGALECKFLCYDLYLGKKKQVIF